LGGLSESKGSKMSENSLLQVTFSKKGTKITPKTHIIKFEILYFSDNISKIFRIFSRQKSVPHPSKEKKCTMEWIP